MHTSKNLFLLAAALLVIGGGVVFYYYFEPTLSLGKDSLEKMSEAVYASWRGDYARAFEGAQRITKSGPSNPQYFSARALEQSLAMFQAGSQEDRIALVRAILDDFETAEEPHLKAYAVNRLALALEAIPEQYLFDEVFTNEPFRAYAVPGDRALTLRKLAEFSRTLYPTPDVLVNIARWHAGKILNSYTSPALSSDARQANREHAQTILQLVGEAETVFQQERPNIAYSPFAITVEPRFYYWKGFLLGAVSLTDASYTARSRAAFAEVFRMYDERRNPQGDRYALVSRPALDAHISYTRFILTEPDVYGTEEEARTHLRGAAEILRAYPDTHSIYLEHLQALGADTEEGRQSNSARLREWRRYVRFGVLSSEFRNLLLSLGWQESDFGS